MSIHLFIKKSVLCFFHLPLPPKTPKKAPEKKWRKTPPSPPSLTPNPPLPIPPWSPMPPNDLTPPRHRCLPHGLPCCPTPPRFQRTWQMFVSTQVGTPRFLGKKKNNHQKQTNNQTPTWEKRTITCPLGILGGTVTTPFSIGKKFAGAGFRINTMFLWWHGLWQCIHIHENAQKNNVDFGILGFRSHNRNPKGPRR